MLNIGELTTVNFVFYNVCLVVEEAYDDVGVAFGIQFLVSPRHMTNVSKSLFLYRSVSRSLLTQLVCF